MKKVLLYTLAFGFLAMLGFTLAAYATNLADTARNTPTATTLQPHEGDAPPVAFSPNTVDGCPAVTLPEHFAYEDGGYPWDYDGRGFWSDKATGLITAYAMSEDSTPFACPVSRFCIWQDGDWEEYGSNGLPVPPPDAERIYCPESELALIPD